MKCLKCEYYVSLVVFPLPVFSFVVIVLSNPDQRFSMSQASFSLEGSSEYQNHWSKSMFVDEELSFFLEWKICWIAIVQINVLNRFGATFDISVQTNVFLCARARACVCICVCMCVFDVIEGEWENGIYIHNFFWNFWFKSIAFLLLLF